MTDAPLRLLVVDDEPLAVERLQLLLARVQGVIVDNEQAQRRVGHSRIRGIIISTTKPPAMRGP